jgi:nucleoside-diphosphate-sugar epimerase
MKVLVTGGAGYLGSILVEQLLAAGHATRVLDDLRRGEDSLFEARAHPGITFVRGDIRDPRARETALEGIEAVVHLAAIVGDLACARDPVESRAINEEASFALIDEARSARVSRFVFASTCSNYGRMADPTTYLDETAELHPVSLYAETKVAVERVVLDPARTGDLCATAVRLATLFGVSPRMRFDLTVNEFVMELIRKRRLVVYGEQFWRPYVHVRDAAKAIGLVLGAPVDRIRAQVFNVGATAENYRKLDLVKLIEPYAPDATVEYVKRTEDPRDYRVSFEKIARTLGFAITRTVPGGISELATLASSDLMLDWEASRYRN